MDIFTPLVILVIAVIILTVCGYCCKRKSEGTVYGYNTTITTTASPPVPGASPVVVPPYPVDPRHPTPHSSGPPAPGFTTHTTPYPTSMPYHQPASPSYPPVSIPGVPGGYPPYPPTSGVPPYPTGAGDPHANPPPYDVAVASHPIHPPVQEAYGKQCPYNPGYN